MACSSCKQKYPGKIVVSTATSRNIVIKGRRFRITKPPTSNTVSTTENKK